MISLLKNLSAQFFSDRQGSSRFELYAKLSLLFNSYFELRREYVNKLSGLSEKLIFISPYVDSYKEKAADNCPVYFWNLDKKRQNLLREGTRHIEYFGAVPTAKIFLPLQLRGSYEVLFRILGEPDGQSDGWLTSSGRSLWINNEGVPLGLKFDTSQLVKAGPFSERFLAEVSLWHSIHVAKELDTEKNIFIENEGLSITFEQKDVTGAEEYLRLTFMTRRPNPLSRFKKNDNLIPLASFFSARLWAENSLRTRLGLSADKEAALEQLAQRLAEMLANSLLKTAIHFEAHQQNLNLHVSDEKIQKIICQDLQDTMLDPIGFFEKENPQCDADNENVYHRIFDLQRLTHFNSQGELIKHDGWLREALTISAFYRRYLSNLGHLNESAAALTEQKNFMNTAFEQKVLRYLKKEIPLSEEALSTPAGEASSVLQGDLYWYIDRTVAETHRHCATRYFAEAVQSGRPKIVAEELLTLMLRYKTIVSAHFPIHIKRIVPGDFGEIYDLYDKKIFVARYKNRYVMIIVLMYIHSLLQSAEV